MKHFMAASAVVLLVGCATEPQGGYPGCDPACLTAKGWAVPTHRAQPKYPREALDAQLGGCVVVSFVISADGRADQYQVLDSQPKGVFDRAALTALNDWRFAPPPKPGRYAQDMEFRIEPGQKNSVKCIETPSHDQLNGKT